MSEREGAICVGHGKACSSDCKRVGQDVAGKIGGKHTEKAFHRLDIFLKEVEALPEYL